MQTNTRKNKSNKNNSIQANGKGRLSKVDFDKVTIEERPEINKDLLAKRYLQDDENTWEDVVLRVARHAGKKNGRVREFYKTILERKFFPSRMAYMGTDRPFASSCFVFPVEDSLHGIMQTLSDACKVQKFGGGTGYNFSHLRPKGDLISTSGGEASGPISFMGLYHNAMEVVHRAGKKHAAQMGILNCDHPNIMEFIQCKDKEGAFWTFNISVAVTDKFMEAVKNNDDWDLKFDGKVYKTIKARDLWDYIVQHAWFNGDPGVIYIDTVNRNNRYPEPIEACNPCGEQMLPPYVSCNLGSIDLSRFVVKGKVDWKSLEETIHTGISFLDGSVDAAYWPVDKIRKRTRKFKNIGLGVMGWADMLILLGIPYDSTDALKLGEKVMKFINDTAEKESRKLGKGKRKNTTLTSIAPTGSISLLAGCSSGIEPLFGISTMKNTYVGSYQSTHWIFESIAREQGFFSEDLLEKISKSGTVQNLDVPDNVKRLFKTAMEVDWEWHVKHQSAFQKYTDNAVSKTINLPNDATVDDVNKAYLKAYETGCKSITVYRDGSRHVQVMDVKEKERDKCPNCDAILFMKDGEKTCVTCGYKPSDNQSVTDEINLEKEGNVEISANDSIGVKPIVTESSEGGGMDKQVETGTWKRPMKVVGSTYKIVTPIGTAFITVNRDEDGNPVEVFINIGRAGSDVQAMAEALGRLISKSLKFGEKLTARDRAEIIINQLKGIGGRRSVGFGPNKILSLPDAIAYALSVDLGLRVYDNGGTKSDDLGDTNGEVTNKNIAEELSTAESVLDSSNGGGENIGEGNAYKYEANTIGDICPECGVGALIYQEGCVKCHSCGHSEC